MPTMTSAQVRESFIKFFESKGHLFVRSSPVVPHDDPTLMFTNAGMNQFKAIFLGDNPKGWKRACNSQKCLRVSGKHNDLDVVGRDNYHHTFFEMLGNWSFGDYYKKEAIAWAWELLTEVWKLPKERLFATVYQDDDEAWQIWKDVSGLPDDRIMRFDAHSNFWEMGDTGPCGPCSEIHIDLRSDEEKAKIAGRDLVNGDHPQVIEIWNLVFMQYNRKADGSLEPLPNKVIDTGMGFERLCMALQGKTSNYDTDVFQPLIRKIGEIAGKTYGDNKDSDVAMRVVADHVRTIAFSIADSQLPSNAKAGYVIRRILRRAVRYGYTFLGQREAFMYKLIDTLIESMGDAYPEIKIQSTLIKNVIKEEEDSFLRTLETGIKMLDKVIADTKEAGKQKISGRDAFVLYDTYGFPLDLTELILRENGLEANIEEFNDEMAKQKQRARNAAAVEATDWVELKEGETEFVGYDLTEVDTEILRYRKVKQKNNEFYQIVLSRTPFYAEMGGQVGDKGTLTCGDETIEIFDTKRENNLPIHLSKKLPSDVTESFHAQIDVKARRAIACNHTATHLLHEALREVLGTHVEQKGSYVDSKVLRFDFSHFQKMTQDELRKVERLANEKVRMAIPRCEHRNVPIDEAKALGAMALFGEKYGDKVRVIQYGSSIELCGGTHVDNTGNIGMIKIMSESSIAAGIRRIEAITGENVQNALYDLEDTLGKVRELLNNAPNVLVALQKSITENATLRKQAEEYMHERVKALAKTVLENATETASAKIATLNGPFLADVVKGVAFELKNAKENVVFMAATNNNGKPTLTVMISEALISDALNASKIVREAAKLIQGGGGGQPGFAQAGGKNADGLSAALDKMKEIVLANL